MARSERRVLLFEASIVESGVQIADAEGIGPALDYMLAKGIRADVAFRVLGAREQHRQASGVGAVSQAFNRRFCDEVRIQQIQRSTEE